MTWADAELEQTLGPVGTPVEAEHDEPEDPAVDVLDGGLLIVRGGMRAGMEITCLPGVSWNRRLWGWMVREVSRRLVEGAKQ